MDTTINNTGVKAENRMVLTMTPMEVDAIETALIIASCELRRANVGGIEEFERLTPGSEEAEEACNTLMKFLVCQSVVEGTLGCISDFREKQQEAD